MVLKPWYKVVTPREDLREGKPLDAAEFAVNLDQVRDGRAPTDYQHPERFFERTYLTTNLGLFGGEVVKRLSGIRTETSAIFNMTTQFGGGKTHALTMLWHLATNGSAADKWSGVNKLLDKAGVKSVPKAATAVFVGTEFDSISGRGGHDGTPLRKTPWGEIAYQLGGEAALLVLNEHENQMTAPAGDVIRRFLPTGPCLILMDELMNYMSRSRKSGMASQFYDFILNLSEEVRARDNVVLVISVPASEMEMTAEDQSDYERLKKMLDRLGKAVFMSAEGETSEIIRRRLFEWVGLPDDAKKVITEYSEWTVDYRTQLPGSFPLDNARDAFAASYPFHPMVLSVFERKWQALPRFQRTRGVLRLLALWVSKAYQDGFKGAHKDPLIGLGTAPLDDPMFRAAVFEQLGESRLEGPLTTDICGKKDSHAARLDREGSDVFKKTRLHQKVATTIFFESNGGQMQTYATLPELRLGVTDPDGDIANVETALEALVPPDGCCYFLDTSRNRYWFTLTPNLTKIHADRRVNIAPEKIDERVKTEVQKTFANGNGVLERVFFPEKSIQIPDRAALTLVVFPLDKSFIVEESKIISQVQSMTQEYGNSSRTFKSALLWCVADDVSLLKEEARKVLAWEAIHDEQYDLKLDDTQKDQLAENIKKSQRDLREAVWRCYKNVLLLGKDNNIRVVDLGLVHSSAADSLVAFILNRLRQDGDVEKDISPNFLVRNWPPAFKEWSIKSVKDAFYASPQFPRLLKADVLKDTITRGVASNVFAYVGKLDGAYEPFHFGRELKADEIEYSEDLFLLKKDDADTYLAAQKADNSSPPPNDEDKNSEGEGPKGGQTASSSGSGSATSPTASPKHSTKKDKQISTMKWDGPIPPQKWMNFYTKVLARFSSEKDMKINVSLELTCSDGISGSKLDETKTALSELGLNADLKTESTDETDD